MNVLLSIFLVLFMIAALGFTADAAPPVNPSTAKDNMTSKPIRRVRMGTFEDVEEFGEELWVSTRLGKSGLSCSSCHPDGKGLREGSWPKYIKMADDYYTLDQMINFCMKNPMKAKPLNWNLQKMTALAYYVSMNSYEPEFEEVPEPPPAEPPPAEAPPAEAPPANPCAVETPPVNPCAVETPAANPCAVETPAANPCAVETPTANPCAVETPAVNPCAVETPPVETPAVEAPPVEAPPVNPCTVETPAANPCAVEPSATNPEPLIDVR